MNSIINLDARELDHVGGGYTPLYGVFFWAGVAQTIVTAGEYAYAAGKWVGENA